MFHEILDSKILPPSEKSAARLRDEAIQFVMAGTLTTSWVLEVSTFHLLRNPSILRKLKIELLHSIPNPDDITPLPVLEKLPYLNAVLKETFRLTYGLPGRLARISPYDTIEYTDAERGHKWIIPPGTPVSMSIGQIHHIPSIFPHSTSFDPSRWLDANGNLHNKLDAYLLNFTRGNHRCLGINLAHAELYLSMAAVWRRFGSHGGIDESGEMYEGVRFESDVGVFDLFETGKKDVELYADMFLPTVAPDSLGIRVKVIA